MENFSLLSALVIIISWSVILFCFITVIMSSIKLHRVLELEDKAIITDKHKKILEVLGSQHDYRDISEIQNLTHFSKEELISMMRTLVTHKLVLENSDRELYIINTKEVRQVHDGEYIEI